MTNQLVYIIWLSTQ